MAMSNRDRVGMAFNLLSEGLLDEVDEVMTRAYKTADWPTAWAQEDTQRWGGSLRMLTKHDVQVQLRAITEQGYPSRTRSPAPSMVSRPSCARPGTCGHTTSPSPPTTLRVPWTRLSDYCTRSARSIQPGSSPHHQRRNINPGKPCINSSSHHFQNSTITATNIQHLVRTLPASHRL
jgi:hypothetical protein